MDADDGDPRHAPSTLHRMEKALLPWVSFGVIPLFALANAGIAVRGGGGHGLAGRVSLGVMLGLTLGKPLGITLFAWLATRLGIAALPAGCSWRSLHAVSWLAGIGFTMSMFITGLAFDDPARITEAKLGTFTASFLAALLGWLLLSRLPRGSPPRPVEGRTGRGPPVR
jgi:NhaA family Na+:H+ antiporter